MPAMTIRDLFTAPANALAVFEQQAFPTGFPLLPLSTPLLQFAQSVPLTALPVLPAGFPTFPTFPGGPAIAGPRMFNAQPRVFNAQPYNGQQFRPAAPVSASPGFSRAIG